MKIIIGIYTAIKEIIIFVTLFIWYIIVSWSQHAVQRFYDKNIYFIVSDEDQPFRVTVLHRKQ